MDQGWYDEAAGPVVRPYAMTRGRTRAGGKQGRLDLIALVLATEAAAAAAAAEASGDEPGRGEAEAPLAPEHLDILVLVRAGAVALADLAGELDLPAGVVRVLVQDLQEAGLVRVRPPVPPAELPDESILRDVMDRLRAL